VCAVQSSHASVLLPKLRLPHLVSPQHHVEHPLHCAQQLLVWRRRAPLEVRDDRRRSVALGSELLLRHCVALVVFDFAARLADGLADGDADGFGLDDVV